MSPPYFPITPDAARAATSRFHDVGDDDFAVERRQGAVALGAPHRSRRSGTASSSEGVSVAYLSDHGPGTRARRPRRLRPRRRARAVRRRRPAHPRRAAHHRRVRDRSAHWGHCTIDYAVHVAREAGARDARAVPPLPVARRRPARRRSCATRAITRARIGRPRGDRRGRGPAHAAARRPLTRTRAMPDDAAEIVLDPTTRRFRDGARALRHRRHDHHRDGRRRAGRHRRQLVHVGVARPAARAVLRRAARRRPGRASSGRASSRSTSSARTRRSSRSLFAQKGADRFGQTPWHIGVSGAPVLDDAIAYLDCGFEAEYPGGDHKIVVGRVLDLDMREGARPAPVLQGRVRAHARHLR